MSMKIIWHIVNQGNGPVENHELKHIGNQEEELNLNLVVCLSTSLYSVKEKGDIVQAVQAIVANGMSVCQACARIGLPHQYYYCLKKAIKTADDIEKSDAFIHYKFNGAA